MWWWLLRLNLYHTTCVYDAKIPAALQLIPSSSLGGILTEMLCMYNYVYIFVQNPGSNWTLKRFFLLQNAVEISNGRLSIHLNILIKLAWNISFPINYLQGYKLDLVQVKRYITVGSISWIIDSIFLWHKKWG